MHEIDKAIADISHIRQQIEANNRFQGFTPPIIGLTGVLAICLAIYQNSQPDLAMAGPSFFTLWILLAIICALLTATDAVVRARIAHRDMADMMLATALRQLLPAGLVGAIFGLFILARAPDTAWLLPGLWQMLVALGMFTALPSLPQRTVWAIVFYLITGVASLAIGESGNLSPWIMGLPFGIGQLLAAWILFDARKQVEND